MSGKNPGREYVALYDEAQQHMRGPFVATPEKLASLEAALNPRHYTNHKRATVHKKHTQLDEHTYY